MKQVQEEVKAALGKVQEEMRKYADRKRREGVEFKVGDLVLLSTRELKWHMKGRRLEKLMEQFVEPYKVKRVISTNAIELELPSMIKIYLVVNISRVHKYRNQVEEQKKETPQPMIIKGEKEWEVKKILNKKIVKGKEKFLVQWKGFMTKANT